MTIFSRLTDIVNSNLNALMEHAEDPKKLIRLVIQEMEDTLVEVRTNAVRLIAERKEIERRLAQLTRERDEWSRRAELALTKAREDLARGALVAKAQLAREIEAAETQAGHLAEALARQNEDLARLQAKLADAKSREKALALRRNTAEARLKLRHRLHDNRVEEAFGKFEDLERALDEMEGKVEAYDLGRAPQATSGPPPLHAQFAALEAEDSVQAELDALKARIKPAGGTGA